ncbi:MAG: hypothetical protein IJ882_01675 [Paludibacteraceae bacterium]|nr:hypothetical protein [Paludibacteraceae bacterium]
MKKILFFAFTLVASVLAFTSCDPKEKGNTPENPQEQPLNPAELVHTMWRADSVFFNGEKSGGPHFIVDIFTADKAVLNGDTVTYRFGDNHLIIESREMDVEVTAYTGNTAKLKIIKDGIEIYVSKLPEWDMESMVLEPQTADFVGTWKLAYYTMNAVTIEGAWNTMGTNPGVETWELRADGTATYHSTFTDETENGTWSYEYGMIMVKNPAQSHLRDEDDRITVQPLTKNWMGFVRGEDYGGSNVTYYQWYFARVK